MSPSDALVGTWIVEAGPIGWMLGLRPDGFYEAALGGGDARHWGAWLIDPRGLHPVLVLRLAGAFPMARATPWGPQPVIWTPVEAWPILQITGEGLLFQGGATARRVMSNMPAWPSVAAAPDIPQPVMPATQGGPSGWPQNAFPPVPQMPTASPGGAAPNGMPGFSGIDQAALNASKANAAAMEKARHESAQAFIRTLQTR